MLPVWRESAQPPVFPIIENIQIVRSGPVRGVQRRV